MKKAHVAAIVCFVIAGFLYAFASSNGAAGGFGFLGFIFEIMGWKKVVDSPELKK
jgi:hypothetical protein